MSDAQPEDRLVDLLLGELSDEEAVDLRRESAADPELAADAAGLGHLLDDLRTLTVQPSPRLRVVVRSSIWRYGRLHPSRSRGAKGVLTAGLQIAAVAAALVVAVLFTESVSFEMGEREVVDDREVVALAAGPVRVEPSAHEFRVVTHLTESVEVSDVPGFLNPEMEDNLLEPYAPFAWVEDMPALEALMVATNGVSERRRDARSWYDPDRRKAVIRLTGGSRHLDARIVTLTGEIAAKIDRALRDGSASVSDVALSVRALLAGGSTLRIGQHRSSVRRCVTFLEAKLPDLAAGPLATALSGMMDVAVVSGSLTSRLVGKHATRLIQALYVEQSHRPPLLNWQATATELADAGEVLRLAPAFPGVDPDRAKNARAFVAAHLQERVDATPNIEQPDLLAAQLYGFGDLVDRVHIEHELLLWGAKDLVAEYLVALHHLSWSRFPVRPGWAAFQQELRSVAAIATPESPTDAAALLLALAVNYAAPGSHRLLESSAF